MAAGAVATAQGGAVGGTNAAPAPANAAAALGRPDANSSAQAGREALYAYLDGIAAKDEAARREAIVKITTRAQAEARQQEVRLRILGLMGGGFERTPLNAKVTGSTQMEGFRLEKVVYESQPGFYVTALMYVPDGVTNVKLPAVVMAPGHGASGKAGDYAMAATFARNGFVVLSYDPIGQGERLQYPDPNNATKMSPGDPYPGVSLAQRPTGEHGEAGLQPTLIGDAVARYFAWDGMRAVDYLISRPEVDAEKIGAFGCSGGGAMTALLGAADKRVKAVATACYLTTMETLLPSIGAQDAEQSTPGFIASGFDFADWVELAAPRAYAMVGTVSDMFPWKGFLQTATEARRFYSLFDEPTSQNRDVGHPAGVGSSQLAGAGPQLPTPAALPTPTGPTLNPDTANTVSADAPFQVIAGIGGHGNLRPLTSQIVGFFLVHLAGRGADSFVAGPGQDGGSSPAQAELGRGTPPAHTVPDGALQVTATGQVATSYPGSETVHSLNLKRAKAKLPQLPEQTLLQVQTDVREVTGAEAVPGSPSPASTPTAPEDPDHIRHRLRITTEPGIVLDAEFYRPVSEGKHPTLLIVRDSLDASLEFQRAGDIDHLRSLAKAGTAVFVVAPRPSPPGGEETKASILGPFYLTELRAELVGKTLLGMRVDDVLRAVDFFSTGYTEDPNNITAEASGHMGLVALHAAVLDSRIKHVTVDHVLESYRSLVEAPMPVDAPQDILPGVLEKYDVPDLVRVLGERVTATDWLSPQRASSPGTPALEHF
jgi:cephalosporin-C deacetylase-like acetyl esterase